ncbi:MAG: ATP-dependent 6-phosphofructokinase [Chitinivibrionia bacterium]|nr:ATP-dependent 6-phosphofructokinase [Chitinivibrionia bacterium]
MNIGILTSGGDCAGLNAIMYGFVKAMTAIDPKVKIYGITDGFAGLINREYREVHHEEFDGILNLGGTILGTSRQPYKKLVAPEGQEKVAFMKENYSKMGLDCLIVLGGQGTHKTAGLLSSAGLNIITLPKTIDNDIFGTDMTFGFHSAVDVATECIDRIRTTAASHGRTFVVEIMGNKVGWLALYSGIAGGADIILIPEIPYKIESVIKAAQKANNEKGYCIIAAAEGVISEEEAALPKKDRYEKRAQTGETTASNRIAKAIEESLGAETRVMVPGYTQRGGNPCAYDRVICTQMGAYAARLVEAKKYGVAVAMDGQKVKHNKLSDIAGETKSIAASDDLVKTAKDVGISLGD